MKLLSEKFVRDTIIDYLSRKGWSRNLHYKNVHEHGIDIKVRNNKVSRYWLIEVKGDASSNAKHPRSRREVYFNLVLGQILTRMHTTGQRGYKYRNKYGIGLPATYREKVIKRLPYDVCDKLNLYVFLVDQNRKVELLDWRALKRLQSH